jgi:hypothetical protein
VTAREQPEEQTVRLLSSSSMRERDACERIDRLKVKVEDLERVVGRQNEILVELARQVSLIDARSRPSPLAPDLAGSLLRLVDSKG